MVQSVPMKMVAWQHKGMRYLPLPREHKCVQQVNKSQCFKIYRRQVVDRTIGSLDRPSDKQIIGPQDHRTSGSADQRTSGSADQRTSGSSDHRISGSSDQRISGPSDHRISGPADQRISGPSDHRISGPAIGSSDQTAQRS